MEYFYLIGSVLACFLTVLKIIDSFKNRPILKKQGRGDYNFKNNLTEFNYKIELENAGRRPLIIKKMWVDLLDNEKKQISIHSTVEDIGRKLDCPDIFQKSFSYGIHEKLPKKTYFLRCTIFASGKREYILEIKTEFFDEDEFIDTTLKEIAEGKNKGLVD